MNNCGVENRQPRRGIRLLTLTLRLLREAASDLPPEQREVLLAEVRRAPAGYLRPLLRQRVRNLFQHRIASILGRIVTTPARWRSPWKPVPPNSRA